MNFRGGGLNIHFGDTAPEDSGMLWVKNGDMKNQYIAPSTKTPIVVDILPETIPKGRKWMCSALVESNVYIYSAVSMLV